MMKSRQDRLSGGKHADNYSGVGYGRSFLCCMKSDLGVSKCFPKHHQRQKCPNCGKLGLRTVTCWSETKVSSKEKQIAHEELSRVLYLDENSVSSSLNIYSSCTEDKKRDKLHMMIVCKRSNNHLMTVRHGGPDGQSVLKNAWVDIYNPMPTD